MKKNLVIVLAFVFVMAIAGTAFAAANPFSDVPAKHWAYPAVAQLQKAGIVDGYGDGTYRGDRLATRYEMAQIVAKAMARSEKADASMKALIDKMAVEFAAELNNLGVRVAKLEKNASSIKFSGDARIRYTQNADFAAYTNGDGKGYGDKAFNVFHPAVAPVTTTVPGYWTLDNGPFIRPGTVHDEILTGTWHPAVTTTTPGTAAYWTQNANAAKKANAFFNQRIRLYLSSDLNDKVSFNATIAAQNQNGELAQDSSLYYSKQSFTSQLQYAKAYFTFKDIFPYGSLRIGRDALTVGGSTLAVGGLVYGTYGFTDGVSVLFGKVLKGFVSYGDVSPAYFATANEVVMASAAPSMNVLTTQLQYPVTDKWTIYGYNQKYLSKWGWNTATNATAEVRRDNYGIGVKGMMGDFTLVGDWVTNRADDADFAKTKSTKAWWAMLMYKGADVKKPGTWGLWTSYRDFGSNVIDGNVTGFDFAGEVSNKKGWTYGMNYTISKNVVFTAHVMSLDAKDNAAWGPAKYDNVYYFRTEYWF